MTRRTRLWTSLALLANLVGTFLVTLSFQATSSDFRLVTARGYNIFGAAPSPGNTAYAICVNNYTLAATDSSGSVGIGIHNCPNWVNARPSAVVTAEYPSLLYLGLILSMAGFLIQLVLVSRSSF
jgi:hypothetical protein